MGKVMKTMDGNTAAAHVAYAFTDVAAIYPITPSSVMAEYVDEWAAHNRKNIFGQEVKVVEMQSEAGASGTLHGSLQAGALTTTFTASQGLLLMIPNMYKIAGELLPAVFHVSARAVAAHALSIFGDHSDVMSCRQTGFAMIASGSVQEVMDIASIAHLSAIKGKIPFVHFFDGFRTSHEIQKIEVLDYEDLKGLVDFEKVDEFRNNALNPEHPVLRGTAQNPDIFFQAKESINRYYDELPDIVAGYFKEISKLTGREYDLFNYHGAPDAERVIIAMGSVCDTIDETIDYLVEKGEKVGVIKVHLYRPFAIEYFLKKLPKTVKKIAVLDRTKEPGATGEPLYLDICSVFTGQNDAPTIVGGRYGLGSKDTTPAQIMAVYDNLKSKKPKNGFTIGIVDDVTFKSLEKQKEIDTTPKGTINCKFWGLGGDGTVSANKSAIKIIGDNTDMYAQAYFAYDSKKAGGVTVSHLRFGKQPIKSTYLINNASFVACNNLSYVGKFDMVSDVKQGGTFMLNCPWDAKELEEHLPAETKRHIANNDVNFYTLDAIKIAGEIGLGGRINMVMQSAFFKLADIIPIDEATQYLKDAIKKAYSKKGDKIVSMNWEAVDKGIELLNKIEVPESWKTAKDVVKEETKVVPAFVKEIAEVMNMQKGDTLPVSAFKGREDGTFPQGLSKYEKRGVAVMVPTWIPENCIQCNQCAYVCPHASIRPYLLNEEEVKNAPEGMTTKKAIGKGTEGLSFRMQVSVLDCVGCGNCVNVCPAKDKAIVMRPLEEQLQEANNFDYALTLSKKENPMKKTTVKGSQFEQPMLEFTGACPGCGETPYLKLVTQLFGDRMMIANATGCSSIWGGSAPSTPFAMNEKGQGPAWANSLFEDNAEYGLGMYIGVKQLQDKIQSLCEEVQQVEDCDSCKGLKEAAAKWIETRYDGEASKVSSDELKKAIANCKCSSKECCDIKDELVKKQDLFVKRSQWIVGGDGWAYDIGYGGLDHVLATGEDVNVLVFDTEVYSNTGGQASKATPTGSVAKFAAAGKPIKKKDLGMMAMSYGYVYVAQVSMGANHNQLVKAISEAEAYNGPSLIIAYAPCRNHGIKAGMGNSQLEEKLAVEAGYWHLYRFNPELESEGKNPFVLDSKEPVGDYRKFIMGETRYSSLTRTFPERAEKLFDESAKQAKERYEKYKNLAAE